MSHVLNDETREKVEEDYRLVCEQIVDILTDPKRKHGLVMNSHYLTPSIRVFDDPTELGNHEGELFHYRRIRTALEEALVEGSISPENLDFNDPPYIRNLERMK
jgi:hypothetical protein